MVRFGVTNCKNLMVEEIGPGRVESLLASICLDDVY
jgi:hypothetical protein